ncbi:DUF551 domain-containing protein [Rahnella woolbedingensis]|uniref:DUF551 domain-containing protein n=1 Tax=Rahnella woolbedingensis TaxID=1510574 RepID=A0A419NEP9_9GAMM|nr:DUF551 domain-containing protein [Rahnella woolbedingensis]RJT47215.1 DUF551 domain-containing protein [Rahnella woolbedingensis]
MNNDLEQFSEERLKDMQKHVAAGMALGYADALLIRRVIDIALAAKQSSLTIDFSKMSQAEIDDIIERLGNTGGGHIIAATTPQPDHTEQDGWIKCSEHKPEPEFGVIVTDGKITGMANVSRLKGKPFPVTMQPRTKGYEMECMGDITHWMPLPAAPKPESER